MVSSRLTAGFSICVSRCRRVASSWFWLTDCKASATERCSTLAASGANDLTPFLALELELLDDSFGKDAVLLRLGGFELMSQKLDLGEESLRTEAFGPADAPRVRLTTTGRLLSNEVFARVL